MEVQWPLLIFSVLLGMGSGVLVFLGVGELKGAFRRVRFPLAVTALVLLAAGGIASTFHLGHIDRAFHILGNMESGLSRELFAVAFAGIVTLVYAVLAREDYPTASKVLGVLALIAGIVLPLTAGASFMMPARPAWDTFTLPIMYLGTGLGMGATLAAAVVCTRGDADDAGLAVKLALVGVACSVVAVVAYVAAVAAAPFAHESRSIDRLLSGSLAVEFWGGVALVGIVVPAVLALLAARRGQSGPVAAAAEGAAEGTAEAAGLKLTAGYLWAALACLIVGSVVLRTIMYAVATSVESLIY
ncbi:dimethyl sulfoxide reductase anchor subunit family protein [Adlercreutzia shanghongiae]|uniref:DmsC/YnfH family molybdoenzyme membrane anchor subunit n=1 Tax=Adlercreutzia shanghongiae TaxID=3111773 RepID=A0ABU6IWJ8_9ACTN|nr:DmsC/YnfH family molybdoenzyme membrane anchor subunit [Adlercreutzia sp. R22]MEC4294175.1 DmsC/YnfH family molybdoenzyme membrane anchor subunit [Adlercreutzia sp. R22]